MSLIFKSLIEVWQIILAYIYLGIRRSVKIGMSIHWTLLRTFCFLHHPQILQSLKSIIDYACLHTLSAQLLMLPAHACAWVHVCTNIPPKFCLLYTWYLVEDNTEFCQIRVHLERNWGVSHCPSFMQVYVRCACSKCTLLINVGDQSENMLKVLWRTDFIWSRDRCVLPQ